MSSCGTRLGLSQSGEPLAPPTDWHGWLGGCTSQTILTKLQDQLIDRKRMDTNVLAGCENGGASIFGTGVDQHAIHRGRLIGHTESIEVSIISDNHAGTILDDHGEHNSVILIIRIVDVVGVGRADSISLIDQDFERENELGFVIG